MNTKRKYADISVTDIDTTRIQARQADLNKNVVELAESIKLQGLFSPVLVVGIGDSKYELIAGQRRMKAYRDILSKNDPEKFSTIPAFVYEHLLEWEKKAISINENFNQEPMTEADKIAAVTACYNEFKNMKTTAEKTGISYSNVINYVKYERLPQVLKTMKDDGRITLDTAIQTANLFDLETSNTGDIPDNEIISCADEMQKLTTNQKKRVKQVKKETGKPVGEIIKSTRERKESLHSITTEVTSNTYGRIEAYQNKEDIKSTPLAVSELIEEGLAKNHI